MEKSRPEKWYCLSEEGFSAFCSSANALEKMSILRATSQLKAILCASQQRIVDELFYRALVYSEQCQFKYITASILLMVIQSELDHLLDLSIGDTNSHSALFRFQDTVRTI